MTLDEAIKHCKEKAKEIWQANEEMPSDCKLSKGLCECAKEHEQLAEWLEDYKILLEKGPQGDLISREALRNEVDTWGCNDFDKYDFLEAIDNAPAVNTNKIEYKAYNEGFKDGVEQGIKLSEGRKGEWKLDSVGVYCSECKLHPDYSSNFCPNCGADMRGKD